MIMRVSGLKSYYCFLMHCYLIEMPIDVVCECDLCLQTSSTLSLFYQLIIVLSKISTASWHLTCIPRERDRERGGERDHDVPNVILWPFFSL